MKTELLSKPQTRPQECQTTDQFSTRSHSLVAAWNKIESVFFVDVYYFCSFACNDIYRLDSKKNEEEKRIPNGKAKLKSNLVWHCKIAGKQSSSHNNNNNAVCVRYTSRLARQRNRENKGV